MHKSDIPFFSQPITLQRAPWIDAEVDLRAILQEEFREQLRDGGRFSRLTHVDAFRDDIAAFCDGAVSVLPNNSNVVELFAEIVIKAYPESRQDEQAGIGISHLRTRFMQTDLWREYNRPPKMRTDPSRTTDTFTISSVTTASNLDVRDENEDEDLPF